MNEDLAIERDGHVLRVTITRESRRNAITSSVLAGISQALETAEHDRSLRAIVLTGAGDKAFCSGADLQDGNMFTIDPSEPYGAGALVFRQARRSTVPMIARVNGACMAGGIGLLAMCDLAVARDSAVFGLPEVKAGLFPAQVLTLLQHLIPRRVLTEMCLTGEPITASQALQVGLVNYVSADVDATLDALLGRLIERSPAALRRGLYIMKKIETMSFEESMAFTESQIALMSMTEDAREGQLAFRERRKPIWKGK
jgi:enoyl-CoA hydratase/carnithine racemase